MKNKLILIIVIILFLIGGGSFLFKRSNIFSENSLPSNPANFNLIFKYGVGAKNELNTFNQTYTKDMVMEPSITINLKLSDSELMEIYQKIKDLNLFEESTEPIEKNTYVTPCSNYYLKVQVDSTQKELSWDDCRGRISDKFQQFTNYIIQIIESKEEYKKLPTPEGGYL